MGYRPWVVEWAVVFTQKTRMTLADGQIQQHLAVDTHTRQPHTLAPTA